MVACRRQLSIARDPSGHHRQAVSLRGLYWDKCYLIPSSLTQTKGSLSKFADYIKLRGAVDTCEGWHAIQKDLDKLKKWVGVNVMSYNRTKGKVLQLGHYRLGEEQIQRNPAKKELGCMTDCTE